MDIPYQEINSKTIDRWVEEGWEWGKPVSHEEYEKAKAGTWDVKLTPVKFVPHSWLGELKGKRVLGLASGGGQQMPIFAALGAQCTVLDYSQRQLDSEKLVAEREGYDITIVRADMTKRLPFDENSFDLIFHPVSNCYVYAVLPIWRECARVLKPGGRLVVITYHSLEDRLGKNFLKTGNFEGKSEQDFFGNVQTPFRMVNNKVIVPSDEEIERNPRSRSAKLRIAEKKGKKEN